MNVCIASRSRWGVVGKLLAQFPPAVFDHLTLYVPEGQLGHYKTALLSRWPVLADRIETVPDDWVLATIRVHMAKRAAERGEVAFIMMDDDLRFAVRRGPDTTSMQVAAKYDVMAMLDAVQMRLMNGRWSHVAVAPRFMQQQNGIGTHLGVTKECHRAMCVVGWRLADFFRIDYGRMVARSDFDGTLQSLRQGRPNLILGYWTHDQTSGATPGGCADYRTVEMFDETARALAAYHPGLVTLVNKSNLTSGIIRERVEVRVRWRQALDWDNQRGERAA